MGAINEIMGERGDKKHICSICVNRDTCEKKRAFWNDFKQHSCSSFVLRGGRIGKDQANKWTNYMLDRDR